MGNNKYSRKSPVYTVRDKVLVLCGGETEEIYFNNFKKKYRGSLSNISVEVVTNKKSDPAAVVTAAALKKDEYNEIWCVFDKDDFKDFDDTIDKINKYENIFAAFSNEAVEYWFLLHFENKTGAITRKKLNELLESNLKFEYKKGADTIERVSSILLSKKVEIAEERARVGHEKHKLDNPNEYSKWCSCTTIYQLTKRLRFWSEARK